MTDAAKPEPWFPAPWRVEEDWTAEIIAANGRVVIKLPYPQNLAEAHAIVEAANAALAHSTIVRSEPPKGAALTECQASMFDGECVHRLCPVDWKAIKTGADPSIQCPLPWHRARDGEDDDY